VIRSHLAEYSESIVESTNYLYDQLEPKTTVVAPDGQSTVYRYYEPARAGTITSGKAGLVYEIVNPDGSTIARSWEANVPCKSQGPNVGVLAYPNPYVSEETTTVSGKSSKRYFTLNKNGDTTEMGEEDFGGARVRTTTSEFWYPASTAASDPSNASCSSYTFGTGQAWRLVSQTSVRAGGSSGTVVRRSNYGYAFLNGGSLPRLLQEERHWDNTRAASVPAVLDTTNSSVTTYTYNAFNVLESRKDAGQDAAAGQVPASRTETRYAYRGPGFFGHKVG